MRPLRLSCVCLVGAALLVPYGAVAGDTAPVIVLPDRFGRPVLLDGLDVTGAVIEGDWGLARPGQRAPIIWDAAVAIEPDSSAYFPNTGRVPRRGRLEIDTPHRRVRAAEPYYRQWNTQSGAAPATIYATGNPPPVILAPQAERRHDSRRAEHKPARTHRRPR